MTSTFPQTFSYTVSTEMYFLLRQKGGFISQLFCYTSLQLTLVRYCTCTPPPIVHPLGKDSALIQGTYTLGQIKISRDWHWSTVGCRLPLDNANPSRFFNCPLASTLDLAAVLSPWDEKRGIVYIILFKQIF